MKKYFSASMFLLSVAWAQTITASTSPIHLASAARLVGAGGDFMTGRLELKSNDVVERRYTLTFLVANPPVSYAFRYLDVMQPLKAYNLGQSYFSITCPKGEQVFTNLSDENLAEISKNERYILDFAAICGVSNFQPSDKIVILEQFKMK